MEFINSILQFSWIILRSFEGYIAGGILVTALSLWERYKNRPVAWKTYRYGLIAFLLVSFFAAWRSEREKTESIPRLEEALLDRMNRHHLIDPAYENYYGLVGAFQRLNADRDGKCVVIVTDLDEDPDGIGEALLRAAWFAGCRQPLNGGGFHGEPESVAIQKSEAKDGKVLVRTKKDSIGILTFEGHVGPIVDVERSHELPKELDQEIIWLQVGKNVRWSRQLSKIPDSLLLPVSSERGNEDAFSDGIHRKADKRSE